MNEQILIQSLQELATLKPGNKITMKTGRLTVDTRANGVSRWLSGDSRTNTVIVLASLVDQAIATQNRAITSLLQNSLQGIENLKVTYQKDYGICMQLEEICAKIKGLPHLL